MTADRGYKWPGGVKPRSNVPTWDEFTKLVTDLCNSVEDCPVADIDPRSFDVVHVSSEELNLVLFWLLKTKYFWRDDDCDSCEKSRLVQTATGVSGCPKCRPVKVY
jgi:hypothetical protein